MNQPDLTNSDVPVVLTIASSDSGAGTGIQADLKTFSAFRVFGTCAITAVTSQTPLQLRDIFPVSPEVLLNQILAVGEGFPISAAKTGMLRSRAQVQAVAQADESQGFPILVVDPRMRAACGAVMVEEDATEALKELLLPLARVVTPNAHEAAVLSGIAVETVEDLAEAARIIGDRFDIACVAKGGDILGDNVVDVLYDEGELTVFTQPRVDLAINHGAGCVFSAALTACLARGMLISDAVRAAQVFVHGALENALHIGHHRPLNLFGR